jgi:hypothetical protein
MAEKIIEEQPLNRLFVDMQIVGKLPRDDQVSVPMLETALHDLCCCTHYRQMKRLVKKKWGTHCSVVSEMRFNFLRFRIIMKSAVNETVEPR